MSDGGYVEGLATKVEAKLVGVVSFLNLWRMTRLELGGQTPFQAEGEKQGDVEKGRNQINHPSKKCQTPDL